jgi:hypothetical protein
MLRLAPTARRVEIAGDLSRILRSVAMCRPIPPISLRRTAVLALLVLSACGGGHESTTPPPALAGIWAVTGHRLPGSGAMTDSAAISWYGRTMRLGPDLARSGNDRCDQPRYRDRKVSRDSLLATDYRVSAVDLPMLDSLSTIEVVEVTCAGGDWTTLGGTLISIDADHALAPWNGTFFELTREHDFRASGHGPGWQLEIIRGDSIRMQIDSGDVVVTTPAARETTLPGSGARLVRVITEAHDMGVMMEGGPCIDAGRSDSLPLQVTVMLDGTRYHGCGGPVE